jgi:ABC-type antimicrobial peptide transport system permease subunit
MNRSRIIQSIYTLGVYRALGAKKSKLYGKYLLDSFIMSSFTAVLGFLIVYAFTLYVRQYIPSLGIDPLFALLMVLGLCMLITYCSFIIIIIIIRRINIYLLIRLRVAFR